MQPLRAAQVSIARGGRPWLTHTRSSSACIRSSVSCGKSCTLCSVLILTDICSI